MVGATRFLDEVVNGRLLVPSYNSLLLTAITLLRSHFGEICSSIRVTFVIEGDANSVFSDLDISYKIG